MSNRSSPRALALAAMLAAVLLPQWRSHAAGSVVGYINLTLPPGYHLIANQLSNAPNNSVSNVFPSPPDRSRIWFWDLTNQVFELASTFSWNYGWQPDCDLPPGKGFMFRSTALFTNTIVGTVVCAWFTNEIAGSNRLSLLAFALPMASGGGGSDAWQFPAGDGDTLYLFQTGSQSYSNGFSYFTESGWFDPDGVAGTNGPVIPIATAFFVEHPGAATNWTYHSADYIPEVCSPPAQMPGGSAVSGMAATAPAETAQLAGVTVKSGRAELRIIRGDEAVYSIRFSEDGVHWKTLATNQTGAGWSAPLPKESQGFFDLVQP